MIWKFNSTFEESKSNTIGTYKSIGRSELFKSEKQTYKAEGDSIPSSNVSKTFDKIFDKLELISRNMSSMNQRLTHVENQITELYNKKSNDDNFWHKMTTNNFRNSSYN